MKNMALSDQTPPKPDFVLLPFLTTSHMMPMIHLGCQLAAHGGTVTVITTPANAAVFQSLIDNSIASNHQISVATLEFPSEEAGLPPGIENYSAVKSPEMVLKVSHALSLLKKPMEDLITKLSPRCIVSGMFFPWTVDTAQHLKIPRLVFYPSNFFCHCVPESLKAYGPHERVESDSELFLIPGLPDKIEMKRSQLPDHDKFKTRYGEVLERIKEAETRSYGIIFDTFYDLEAPYSNHFKKIKNMKIWTVGPISHYPNSNPKRTTSTSAHYSLNWLDTQKANSVVYICFGSMTMFPEPQLIEIALALENMKIPFIWVIKNRVEDDWMPDGFKKMVVESERGLVIKEWAPQVDILNHPAIGGYVTHCGWNSVIESVMAGVPMITWPLFAEQFYNEKLITQVLGIGVAVENEVWNSEFFNIKSPVLKKERIEVALQCVLMNGEEMRKKAKEVGKMCARAVEDGGSSLKDLIALIEEVKAFGK